MISQFHLQTKGWKALAIATLVSTSLYSCKESKDSVTTSGKAVVNISLLGVENPKIVTISGKKGSTDLRSSPDKQSETIAFTKTSAFEATLTPVATSTINSHIQASSDKRAAATPQRTALDANVKYKVLVYDTNGNYVQEKTYTNTVDNNIAIEGLNVGQTYTFIAYSDNSTSSVPAITGQNTLSSASLPNVSSDLMYYNGTLTPVAGTNTLSIILKHQYSQITTNLSMDENMTGAITSLLNPFITPSHTAASLKLSDGTISYNGLSTTGANVIFPALGIAGLRKVSSTPTMLIHPSETAGVLNFGSITIDGETKSNVSITGLQIVPGQRYNLNLDFKTCTQDVVGGASLSWDSPAVTVNGQTGIYDKDNVFRPNGDIVETLLTAPGADYGFVVDIYKLDNSFNMEVNGVKLATQEIQFEGAAAQTVKFADGSIYGGTNTEGGSVGQIYNLTGSSSAPLIKVVISRSGEVNLYGSKTSGGPLYPLVLFNGSTLNNISWSSTSNNVKVTQRVQGRTALSAAGSGKKKIPCTP